MDKRPLFYEKQQFRQWWVWLILALAGGGSAIAMIVGYMRDPSFPFMITLLPLFLMVALFFWFWKAALITKLDEAGIYIKFTYFHKDFKFYPWSTIRHCEVKKYNPTMDYGGWGIKPGAYNVSGNMGMLVRFTYRDSLMIGTNRPDDLRRKLTSLGKLKQEAS